MPLPANRAKPLVAKAQLGASARKAAVNARLIFVFELGLGFGLLLFFVLDCFFAFGFLTGLSVCLRFFGPSIEV